MKKKEKTFSDLIRGLVKEYDYENEYGIDYFFGDDDKKPKPYDDYYSITTFGSNEGIYTDFYVLRENDEIKEHIATAKTLGARDTDFMNMHEFGAKVVLVLRKMSI